MSYRDDVKEYTAEHKQRKKAVVLAIKITVVVLAVMFLLTTVMVIVNLVGDSGSSNVTPSGDSSGGRDRTAPVIKLKQGDAIYVYIGENVALKSAVTVTDSSAYKLEVDNSDLNLDKVGTYTITYTATDEAGNSAVFEATVVVTKKEYSYSTLMGLVQAKASDIGITDSMTKREKAETFYNYINNKENMTYDTSGSNIPDIDRDNWKTDWVEEATRTLTKGSGDCYSYYSVSKAFFEYLGIENVGIQRDNSDIPKKEGTHFWLIVNVGETSDQWYYFDSTRLAGTFSDGTKNACLITLAKLQSYTPSKSLGYDFYTFDPTDYPTAATK